MFKGKARARVGINWVAWLVFIGCLCVNFFGCTKNYHFENADEVIQKTEINRVMLSPEATVDGPYAETPDKNALYMLTARYQSNQLIDYQLVIYQTRRREVGPAYYYEALDPQGNKMEMMKFLDTFSDSDEKIGIKIPKDYLYSLQDKGMEFQLYGKRDSLSVRVEGFYIKGFLAKAKEIH